MIKEPILWDKSFQDLYAETLQRIKQNAPEYTALLPSDPGIAVADALLYQALMLGQKLNTLPLASLVAWVNYLGINKKGPTASIGTVRITLEQPLNKDFVIPQGTKFMDSKGLGFDTVEETIIPAGQISADIKVMCEQKGTIGNVKAHEIINIYQRLPYIKYIDNVEPLAGGFDSELDADTLDRGRRLINHLWRAVTSTDYEEIARAVPGVYKAKAIDSPGEVRLYVLSEDGQPANPEVLNRTLTFINPMRCQGTGLSVMPAVIKYIDITVNARLLPGFSASTVRALLTAKLSAVINPMCWQWGRKAPISEMMLLIEETQGVDYVEELLLPAENIRLEPYELASVGEVNLYAL